MNLNNLNDTEYKKLVDKWLEGPALQSPDGVSPDYLDGPSLQKYDVLCQSIGLTLVTTLVLVRVYTRARILKSLGWDDYTSVGAWLGLIALGIVVAESDRYGAGRYAWNISARDWLDFSRLMNGFQISYTLVILLTKISIFLVYLRIFSPSRMLRIVIHANLWANILFYTIGFFLAIMMCLPREALWNPYIRNPRCLNITAAKLASAVFNVVSDFAILILPVSTVWKLQMQRRKKMAVSAVFAIGLIGCIAGLIRLSLFANYVKPLWSDDTWRSYPMVLWSYVEISAGITCGCMPALPAFCRHLRDHRRTKRGSAPNDELPIISTSRQSRGQESDVEVIARLNRQSSANDTWSSKYG